MATQYVFSPQWVHQFGASISPAHKYLREESPSSFHWFRDNQTCYGSNQSHWWLDHSSLLPALLSIDGGPFQVRVIHPTTGEFMIVAVIDDKVWSDQELLRMCAEWIVPLQNEVKESVRKSFGRVEHKYPSETSLEFMQAAASDRASNDGKNTKDFYHPHRNFFILLREVLGEWQSEMVYTGQSRSRYQRVEDDAEELSRNQALEQRLSKQLSRYVRHHQPMNWLRWKWLEFRLTYLLF